MQVVHTCSSWAGAPSLQQQGHENKQSLQNLGYHESTYQDSQMHGCSCSARNSVNSFPYSKTTV